MNRDYRTRNQGGAHWMNWRWTVLVRDEFGDVTRVEHAKTLEEIRESLAEGESVEVRDERDGGTRIVRRPRSRK